MRTSTVILTLLLAAGFIQTATAQVRPWGDAEFIVGVPLGEFRDEIDEPGFGAHVAGGIGIGASPILIGTDLGILVYGQERRSEAFSPNIPEVTVDVRTTNNIFLGHFLVRLQPPTGQVLPYLDGLIGLKYFFTQSSVESEGAFDDEPIATSTNFDDAALSYGVGTGIGIRVYGNAGEAPKLRALYINLGVRYLLGTEATYLDEGGIERLEDGTLEFDTRRSRTDMLLPHFGVRLAF